MSKKIIEAMNGYVVEMTEKRAKKARKMIEGKGMKVEEKFWRINEDWYHLYFEIVDNTFNIINKNEFNQIMPWKQFKSMFKKKKNKVHVIHVDLDKIFEKHVNNEKPLIFGIDFGLIGSDVSVENIIKHETTDTAKPEKEQEIDWSKIQVVESKDSKVITSGNHKEAKFSGMMVECVNIHLKGFFASDLNKADFKLSKDQTLNFD